MSTHGNRLFVNLLACTFLFSFGQVSDAQLAAATAPRTGPYTLQITPQSGIVFFQQVMWDLEYVKTGPSKWGQVDVDVEALRRLSGHQSGYLNVLLFMPGSNEPHWVIPNLHLPPPDCTANTWTVDRYRPPRTAQPMCRYFDILPHLGPQDANVSVPEVFAVVVLSGQPLPTTHEVLRRQILPLTPLPFIVSQLTEDTEGWLPDPMLGTFPPRTINRLQPLGGPPTAITPSAFPDFDLVFPIQVFQDDWPNIQCAKNQCVPMGQNNAIQFLEYEYSSLPLIWNLPQLAIPGFGRQTSAGDVIFWEPVPNYSVIANVDFFTRRNGVFDADSGSGSGICQLFRGMMAYLTLAGPYTTTILRHQGTDSTFIGDFGLACDNVTFDLGGRISVRQGTNPTWDWIYAQLVAGRAVAICFGRYDTDGERTGGHCVRVYGACDVGGTKYLYTLDDGNQGSNFAGLRTQVWNVEDTGGPGNPGVPDGRMNMDGMSWEIEFANSIEAKPTLLIP